MGFFLLFLGVPLVEIALFVVVGGAIGLWPTLGCVLLSAILGATVLRRQGLRALGALQTAMARGEDPSDALASGAMLLLAGALLLTPGFFTDAVGLALLSPAVRARAAAWIGPRLARRVVVMGAAAGPRAPRAGDMPIDAEYRDVTDRPDGGR